MRAGFFLGFLVFVLAVAALAGVALTRAKPTARAVRVELMRELQPVVLSNCVLQRVGSANDGGYLMCGNLLGAVRSAYSYGIGPFDDWGCEISQTQGIPVHQYDCFNPPVGACASGRSTFHDECVGPRREVMDGRTFDTIVRQVARNGDTGRNLVMKIDIEGAELDSIFATPASFFDKVDQLAMEIHGTDARFLELVRRLKRRFDLVHVHFNNQACGVKYRPLPAWAYQVLFVNKRLAIVDPAKPKPILPHPLDAPDYALGRDCQGTRE